ncbi:hypothetical protein N8Q31_26125, partial [Enterobacter hormaechei subsp. xiangfangensis]|nr:hypothetical protein [Enterobacter hormaechei subsp. xiangfangensis]
QTFPQTFFLVAVLPHGFIDRSSLLVQEETYRFQIPFGQQAQWGSRDFPSKNDKVLWRPRRPWPPEGYYFSLTGKYPSIERIS